MVKLNGKPLIQYSIEAARNSTLINSLFISSDDHEIINFCKSLGVEVPYLRPASLATDEAAMIDVVLDALDWMGRKNRPLPEAVLLLQPTSPLRGARDIDRAIEMFVSSGAESLMSVNIMTEHPCECIRLKDGGWEFLLKPPPGVIRRQDYREKGYFINGAIYLTAVGFLQKEKSFVVEGRTVSYFMDAADGVDIDDMLGLMRAEFFQHQQSTMR